MCGMNDNLESNYEMFEFLHGAPYAICIELKYFNFFVFCLFRV